MSGNVGVHAMSITPFDRSGALDDRLVRAHLRFLGAAGVGVYVASQGSGEGDLLSFDEKVTLYRIAAEELKGDVPVVAAGIGLAASTATTRDLALAAQDAGVDAVQVVAPRPGPLRLRDDELEAHFRTVIEAVRCPVHLSNNTALAGYALPVELVVRLVDDYAHLTVVNVSEPRVDALRDFVIRLVDRFGARLEVRVGMIREIVAMHALGAGGVLCFEPNVSPRMVTDVWAALVARPARRRGRAPAAEHGSGPGREPEVVEGRARDPRSRRRSPAGSVPPVDRWAVRGARRGAGRARVDLSGARAARAQQPKPYNRSALPCRIASRSAAGTPANVASIASHEWGQSLEMCG